MCKQEEMMRVLGVCSRRCCTQQAAPAAATCCQSLDLMTQRCWACTGWRTHTGRLHLSGCCSCVPHVHVRKQCQAASP